MRHESIAVRFVSDLPDEVERIMRDGLVEYELARGVDVNHRRFALLLTIEPNQRFVVGVLNAYTAFAEVYIDDMWIHKEHRSKGLGRTLLRALEDHFEGHGFNNINLVTSAFQAPGFYEKCGFIPEFVRKNSANPKLTKTFFVKYFKNVTQTQGSTAS